MEGARGVLGCWNHELVAARWRWCSVASEPGGGTSSRLTPQRAVLSTAWQVDGTLGALLSPPGYPIGSADADDATARERQLLRFAALWSTACDLGWRGGYLCSAVGAADGFADELAAVRGALGGGEERGAQTGPGAAGLVAPVPIVAGEAWQPFAPALMVMLDALSDRVPSVRAIACRWALLPVPLSCSPATSPRSAPCGWLHFG